MKYDSMVVQRMHLIDEIAKGMVIGAHTGLPGAPGGPAGQELRALQAEIMIFDL